MIARRVVSSAVLLAVLVGSAVPAGAGREEPRIWARPSTDLVHGQRVEVRGEGFRGAEFLMLAQCDRRVEAFDGCDGSSAVFLDGGVEDFAVVMVVERVVDSRRFGAVDCASEPGACVIAAFHRATRPLDVARLAFDPEGPPAPPPLEIDLDIARAARVAPDGRRALVDVEVTCAPGMHAYVFVEVMQETGEDDVRGFGEGFVPRCHGTVPLALEVHAFEGLFTPGDGVAVGTAFGFRDSDYMEAEDSERVRVTLQR